MTSLNFKHLRYFWMVAKSGSITRADQQLHLTPQSISDVQLRRLAKNLCLLLFASAKGVANLLVKTRLRYLDLDLTWLDVFKLGNAQLQHPMPVFRADLSRVKFFR